MGRPSARQYSRNGRSANREYSDQCQQRQFTGCVGQLSIACGICISVLIRTALSVSGTGLTAIRPIRLGGVAIGPILIRHIPVLILVLRIRIAV